MTVDEFVKTKVLPEYRPVVAAIRSLMKDAAPKAHEEFSYGMPVFALDKPIAWITASKTGITLGFREGASFEDKYGLLRAASRHSKNMKLKSLADVNKPAIKYYVRQALKIDKG
jgi:hypothetical protein